MTRSPLHSASPLGAALAALALLALPLAAQNAVPGALTLEQAVALAHENNPTLLGQRNDVRVSEGSVRSAYGELLPTLNSSFSFGYTAPGERRSGSVVLAQQPSVYSSSYSLGASYSLSAPRLFQPRVVRGELNATRARVAGAEATLASDVAQRYLGALQAAEQVEQAKREVARLAEHAAMSRDRLQAGTVTPLDAQQAEVQHGRAEIRLLRAENAHATEMQALARLMGMPLGPEVRLTSRFELSEPKWERAALVERAIRNNAGLRAAGASLQSAEAKIRSARAGFYPSLNLSLNLNGWKQVSDEDALVRQRMGTEPWDPATEERVRQEVRQQNRGFPFGYNRQPVSASMSVSVPVFQGFSRGQQVQQARATAEDARLQLRAEEQRVEQEVSTALLDLQSAFRAARMGERVVAAAAEGLEMARERFRLGMSNSLAVMDAQGNLSQAEQEQTTAVFDFHRALARLEALLGESLR